MPTDEVIDLTLSEDEGDVEPDSRRKRTRYDVNDEVVIVEGSETAIPKPNEPETINGGGDDDVMLVSTNGVEDWTSLPHTRDICRQCPFTVGMNASNATFCDRCFCYICDCPASECKQWGSGNARAHHCNATAKSPTYRTQRQERLKQNRVDRAGLSNAVPGAVAPTRPSAVTNKQSEGSARPTNLPWKHVPLYRPSGTGAMPLFAPIVSAGIDTPPSPSDNENDPNCHSTGQLIPMGDMLVEHSNGYNDDNDAYGIGRQYEMMVGARMEKENTRFAAQGPKPCNLKEMPDPLLDPSMIELTQLSFKIKTRGDNKISDISRRLAPHGFYKPTSDNSVGELGDKLTLRSMIEDRQTRTGLVSSVIKVIPSGLMPQPSEPSPTRVVPILVHFWDGRALPTVHGVTITPGCKEDVMLARLRELLKIYDESIVMHPHLVFGNDSEYRYDDSDLLHWSTEWSLTDKFLAQNVFAKDGVRLEVFCVQERLSSYPPKRKEERPFTAAIINLLPTEAYDEPYSSTDNTLRMKLVVPIRDDTKNGGNGAKATVARDLVAALRQYRQNPDDADESRALASSLKICWGYRKTSSNHAPFECHMDDERLTTRGGFGGLTFSSKRLRAICLRASFPTEIMEASFLPDFWGIRPLRVDTASPSVIEPTRSYLKAFEKVRKANIEELSRPERTLKELETASEMKDLSTIPLAANLSSLTASAVGPAALVRYKAQITPLVEETGTGKGKKKKAVNEKKGTLKIRVFVFRSPARNRVSFFDQGLDWGGPAAPSGRRRSLERTIVPHKLKNTLWHHLQHNSDFLSLEDHRQHWAEKDTELSAKRSITALMDAMERPECPAAVQPNGLTVTLRPYQLQSLKFMWDAEIGDGGFRRHLWVPATAVDGTPFWYSPLLGKVASSIPEQPSGGFCCEEMGLGKTVEVLALCLANPAPALPAPGTLLRNKKLRSKATLVVCAVSLVGQWIAEAKEKTAGSLKIHMYHGQGRIKEARRLATEFDLIVTTYATLSSDCGTTLGSKDGTRKTVFGTNRSPLHAVEWHRLVLDESHTCKNPVVGHTKACVALEAQRRWMCTGTPINTDIQDLYGQFAVLRFAPFNNKNFFDANVRNTFGNHVYGGCPELLHALGAIMIRHTKRQELGGEQVLQLPPKTEELVPVILTATEQAVYKRVHATAAEYFSRYERMGPHFVSKNLLHIMSLLLPMRRICSGGALSERDLTVSEPDVSAAEAQDVYDMSANANSGPGNNAADALNLKVDESLVAPANEECPICMDAYEEPAVTTCNHWYCKACIVNVLRSINPRCPLCRSSQRVNQLRCGITASEAAERLAAENENNIAELAAGTAAAAAEELAVREAEIVSIGDGVISESKLAALLKSLRQMRRADRTAKALIFSQYNSTIEWLKGRLTREGFGHRHISGSMPLKQRAKAIQAFQGDPPTTVFLLSMRSGAVGINLTAASHVFLMEPALNPALEDQAVGRAWRMGQQREVKVVRFYVQGSVEEQIMKVVKIRQTGVAGAAAAANGANTSDEERWMNRVYRPDVRVEDQAGSIKADKQNLRLNELQALFKAPEFPEPREDDGLTDEDEPMLDAVDYTLLHQRNNRQQYMDALNHNNDGAGTSAMHAAMGNNNGGGIKIAGAGVPAAVIKNRMRRSKAGIASVAGGSTAAIATGTTATAAGVQAVTPGSALDTTTDGAGPSDVNRNGPAAHGVTPAATLHAAAVARGEEPQQEEEEKEAEGVVEMAPEAILQRIKLLAQRATGRLTPAVNGAVGGTSQRAAAVLAKAANATLANEPDTDNDDDELDEEALDKLLDDGDSPEPKGKRARGRSLPTEAITAHIPNATPDTTTALAAGGGVDGRPSRRTARPNYAVLANQGDTDNGAVE